MMREFHFTESRKFLPLAIFVLVTLALTMSALFSIADIVSQRSALSSEIEMLAKLKDKAAQIDGRAPLNAGDYLIEAASLGVATAELQRRVSELLADAGADLQLSETIPADSESGIGRLAIAVNFEIDEGRLTELLFKIENSKPALLIERIAIRHLASEPSVGRNRLQGTATIVAAWRAQT